MQLRPEPSKSLEEIIKEKVKQTRFDSKEEIDTRFYVTMQSYETSFLIVQNYQINNLTFATDVHQGSESLEQGFHFLFDKIRKRHQEVHKTKSLVEQDIKETLFKPFQSISGFFVKNGTIIYPFHVSSPRETTRLEFVRDGLFSKREVEFSNEKQENEMEYGNYFYTISVDENPLEDVQLLDAKVAILQATQRQFSFSDEMIAFKNFERTWSEWETSGEVPLPSLSLFLNELEKFRKQASPEIFPLLEQLTESISKRKGLLHQYQLLLRLQESGTIYF